MNAAKASPEQLQHLGQQAALRITSGMRVGLGSGRAAEAFVRALGARIKHEHLEIIGIPTSRATEAVAREVGIPLGDLETVTALDIAVDGADEVDTHLQLIKGGGGHLLREKVIASMARQLIILVGFEKVVAHLGQVFPVFVEVVDFALPVVQRRLTALGATVSVRLNAAGAWHRTDNGNPLLHAQFPAPGYITDAVKLDAVLHTIPGVLETGLFINLTDTVMIANADGSISTRQR
jgi:ribose 5-phosphate isomerase A